MKYPLSVCLSLLGAFLAVPVMAQQTALPGSKLAWEQGAVDLTEANSLSATLYEEGATPILLVAGKDCVGVSSPFSCSVPLPAFTVGLHTVRLTVSLAGMESSMSDPLTFRIIVIQTPKGLRIVSITHIQAGG